MSLLAKNTTELFDAPYTESFYRGLSFDYNAWNKEVSDIDSILEGIHTKYEHMDKLISNLKRLMIPVALETTMRLGDKTYAPERTLVYDADIRPFKLGLHNFMSGVGVPTSDRMINAKDNHIFIPYDIFNSGDKLRLRVYEIEVTDEVIGYINDLYIKQVKSDTI